MKITSFLLVGLASLAVLTPAAQAVTAGSFEFVSGDVRVRNAGGVERVARRGERLEVGEAVISGAQSNAQVRMVDDAFIAVRPESEVNISSYSFSGRADGNDNALLRLVKGTMRAFTGAISQNRRERFLMATPTATVGIRGSGNVLHFSPTLGTLNHTIEGSHAVSSVNALGQVLGTVVTNPGQTVQVFANQAPVRIPTPIFLVQAASSRPAAAAQGGQGGQRGQGGEGGAGPGQQTRGQGGAGSGDGGGSEGGSGSGGGGSAASRGDGAGGPGSQGGQPGPGGQGGPRGPGGPGGSIGSRGGPGGGFGPPGTVAGMGRVNSGLDTGLFRPGFAPVTPQGFVINPLFVIPKTLTGTTSEGSTLNTFTSTVTTSSGSTTPIGGSPVISAGVKILASYYTYPASLATPFGTNDVSRTASFDALDGSATFGGPNGNFSAFAKGATGDNSLTIGGDQSGASTVTTLGNGISFGRYASQTVAQAFAGTGTIVTVTGKDGPNNLTNERVIGSLQWIAGPGVLPVHRVSTLTGAVTFGSPTASAPTDQNNLAGSPSNVNASLLFNFDKQSVNTSVSVTMAPNATVGGTQNRAWVASGSNLALDDGGGFHASSGSQGAFAHNTLSITLNGSSATGNISGQLTGNARNGAILSYSFGGNDTLNFNTNLCGGYCHEHVNGVVGFGSATFAAAPVATAPYYVMLSAQGMQGGFDSSSGSVISVGSSNSVAQSRERYVVPTGITFEDANRVKFNTQGAVTQYDSTVPLANVGSCTGGCSSETPVRLSILPTGSAAFTGANGALVPAMPSITSTAATVLDFGTDATTGISWGRYSNDKIAVVDRVTGNTLNANGAFGPVNHYLLSPQQTGATVLPATGSATYTFIGGTNPTDTTGAIGVLNSATLSANFTAQTISTSVNASVGGRNWTASTPVAVPIIAGVGFEAARSLVASTADNLAVSCAGSGCASSLAGRISGVFTGTTGQGAGLAYSLNTGGANGITVGGVAAFKR